MWQQSNLSTRHNLVNFEALKRVPSMNGWFSILICYMQEGIRETFQTIGPPWFACSHAGSKGFGLDQAIRSLLDQIQYLLCWIQLDIRFDPTNLQRFGSVIGHDVMSPPYIDVNRELCQIKRAWIGSLDLMLDLFCILNCLSAGHWL